MRTWLMMAALFFVASLSSGALADEPATTSELPAALQQLGVEQSRILTTQQAEEVRGEAFALNFAFTFSGGGVNVSLSNPAPLANVTALISAVNAGGVLFSLQ